MNDDPIKQILARHGIDDPSDHLLTHGNSRVDTTPRIEGVPVSRQTEAGDDALLAEVRAQVLRQHDAIVEEVATDLPWRR
jgi:hypothetical protein